MKEHLHTITKALGASGVALAVVLIALSTFATPACAHEGMEHITGTVVSVGENTLSVKTTKGATVEIRLDANTQYVQGKDRVTLSDLKPGSRVVVHATKTNGTFIAHEVSIGVSKPLSPAASKGQE